MIFLEAGNGMVRTLGFTADGGRLFAHTRRGAGFRMWEGSSFEPVALRFARNLRLQWLAYTGIGNYFVGVDGSGSLRRFDIFQTIPTGIARFTPGTVSAMAIDAKGQCLAVAAKRAGLQVEIRRFLLKTGRELQPVRGHNQNVLAMAFSPDGNALASGSRDRDIRLWDMVNARELTEWNVRKVISTPLAFFGSLLARTAALPTPNEEKERLAMKAGVRSLAFAPDGRHLLAANGWSVAARAIDEAGKLGRPVALLRGHKSFVEAVAISPDGSRAASGSRDGTVKVWSVATGEMLASHDWGIGKIHALAFAPDGLRLACGSETGKVVVWDAE